MTPANILLVQSSWAQVAPIATTAAEIFYEELFSRAPELRRLFKGDMREQGDKLMQMIGVAVGKLDQPDVLVPVLRGLGQRHLGYGVADAHYDIVGASLLATLEKGLGTHFTPDVRKAWASVYGVMVSVMTGAGAAAKAA